jgi:two-component system, chemotaxis family, protein-glutamate methylesterase/glutaminase
VSQTLDSDGGACREALQWNGAGNEEVDRRACEAVLFRPRQFGKKTMSTGRAIAIGGSTGSLAALKVVLPRLPADLPAPVFLVVHVGSHGRDLVAGILDGLGPLRVTTAQDGEDVEAGRIYVAPADRHLLIIDQTVRLGRGPRENMARPAVDALFNSVAATYRSGAIGLILTGNLHDGAAGLAAIKRCGGLTAVQDPAEAVAPEMPFEALEASDVDYRAPLEDLPGLIVQLAQEPLGPPRPVPRALELEVDIALGRPCRSETIAEMAEPAPLSCPACGGVLSQLDGGPLRFRCQVGHAFTARALEEEQEGSLDEAVRVALRIVEERAVLAERMARDAAAAGRPRTDERYRSKAADLRQTAEVLRSAALRLLG